ncbi:hypothetical protein [Pseudorhodobacter sp.]|uniref:hypothetical protein n=1 Tax=Pseudorhodobacter sp. TaxID=1934400 RepID=UPI0026481D8A|nr:hypothetical protein [Pseudorhodobacter sp.]MDN5786533.1 hypothetical protein [Pseudorhodobacter sp.]
MAAFKKLKREKKAYVGFRASVIDELGDTFGYFTAIARRFDVSVPQLLLELNAAGSSDTQSIVASDDPRYPIAISNKIGPKQEVSDQALVNIGRTSADTLSGPRYMTLPSSQSGGPLFSFMIAEDFSMSAALGSWVAPAVLLLVIGFLVWLWFRGRIGFGSFELDSAGIGIGDTTVSFKPNRTDRQIAYAIWVELSTRKVGLAIDPEHDVIAEVHDSWYSFFGVTRDLIKEVPAISSRAKGRGRSSGLRCRY